MNVDVYAPYFIFFCERLWVAMSSSKVAKRDLCALRPLLYQRYLHSLCAVLEHRVTLIVMHCAVCEGVEPIPEYVLGSSGLEQLVEGHGTAC